MDKNAWLWLAIKFLALETFINGLRDLPVLMIFDDLGWPTDRLSGPLLQIGVGVVGLIWTDRLVRLVAGSGTASPEAPGALEHRRDDWLWVAFKAVGLTTLVSAVGNLPVALDARLDWRVSYLVSCVLVGGLGVLLLCTDVVWSWVRARPGVPRV